MAKSGITGGQIVGVGVLALLAYGAYRLATGEFSLGNLFGNIAGALLPGDIGRGAVEGGQSGGVPGATGGIIYNIMMPGDQTLGEKIEDRADILKNQDTPGDVYQKAKAETVAEDIINNPLLSLLPGTSAGVIGAGIGAVEAQGKYLESLPEDQALKARQDEYLKREQFIAENIFDISLEGALTRIGAPILAPWHILTRPDMTQTTDQPSAESTVKRSTQTDIKTKITSLKTGETKISAENIPTARDLISSVIKRNV